MRSRKPFIDFEWWTQQFRKNNLESGEIHSGGKTVQDSCAEQLCYEYSEEEGGSDSKRLGCLGSILITTSSIWEAIWYNRRDCSLQNQTKRSQIPALSFTCSVKRGAITCPVDPLHPTYLGVPWGGPEMNIPSRCSALHEAANRDWLLLVYRSVPGSHSHLHLCISSSGHSFSFSPDFGKKETEAEESWPLHPRSYNILSTDILIYT